jgi:hypothetical protein
MNVAAGTDRVLLDIGNSTISDVLQLLQSKKWQQEVKSKSFHLFTNAYRRFFEVCFFFVYFLLDWRKAQK